MEPRKLKQTGTPEQLTLLPNLKNLEGLSKEENKILQAKYSGTRFEIMTDAELFVMANDLAVKINIIVGWQIPKDLVSMNELFNQLSKKLNESYGNMNAAEVELAFRSNVCVKDWGKNMNLALIDEVLAPYLEKRYQVSLAEEMALKPPVIAKQINYPIVTEEELLNGVFEMFKKNQRHEFIPVNLFHYLEKTGKLVLTKAEKIEIMDTVRRMIKINIKNDRDFAQQYLTLDNKELFIQNESRKFAVAQYFNKLITQK